MEDKRGHKIWEEKDNKRGFSYIVLDRFRESKYRSFTQLLMGKFS